MKRIEARSLSLVMIMIVVCGGMSQAQSLQLTVGRHQDQRSARVSGEPELTARESRWHRVWQWSAAALIAGNSLDATSSWGGRELNGMLASSNGAFGSRGVMLKGGICGGILAMQYFVGKRHPRAYRAQAITNFASAALFTGIAVHNWQIKGHSIEQVRAPAK
jgi:hypothetical protein